MGGERDEEEEEEIIRARKEEKKHKIVENPVISLLKGLRNLETRIAL